MALNASQVQRLVARSTAHPVVSCERCRKRTAFATFKLTPKRSTRPVFKDLCAQCGFEVGGDRTQTSLKEPSIDDNGTIEYRAVLDSQGQEITIRPLKYGSVAIHRSFVTGLKVDTRIPPAPPKPKRARKTYTVWTPTPEWLASVRVKESTK